MNPPPINKAPDSQTSHATCQKKEKDRAHRSHSTRKAKQNKTNKNQGSPIKTIKSHDSILVPLLGRGVFTTEFAPARCCLHIKNRPELYPVSSTLLFLPLQGKETNFRCHKLTHDKVQKNNDKIKKDPEKVPALARKI